MKNLLKDKRNIWHIIAMLAGVVAIIVGVWFLDRKFYSVSMLDELKFGADFYTEMYNASRRIHGVVGHINDLIEYVKKGIGFAFIFGGIADICFFGSKLNFAKNEIDTTEITPTSQPEISSVNETTETEESNPEAE